MTREDRRRADLWSATGRPAPVRPPGRRVHELTDEEWGVRRFFVRDPAGHIVNVLSHLH